MASRGAAKRWLGPALIGVGLGALYWLVETEVHTYVLRQGTFAHNLLSPSLHELWMRTVVLLLLAGGLVAIAIIGDMRDRREEIWRQREHMEALYQSAPDPMVCIDANQRVVYANAAAEEASGLAHVDLRGRRCFEVLAGSAVPCAGCRHLEVLQNGVPRTDVKYVSTASGQELWLERTWSPLVDRNGAVEAVVEVSRDITRLKRFEIEVAEREHAEAELRTERNRARNYLDTAAAVMVALDADGRITMVNRRGCELLGLCEDELLGSSWVDRFTPSEGKEATRRRYAAIMAGEEVLPERSEEHILCPDGRLRIYEWGNTLLHDAEGTIVGILSSGDDVTERRWSEHELAFKSHLLDKATDALVVHRADGRAVYVNEAACELSGLLRESFLLLEPWGWLAPQFHDIARRSAAQMEEDGFAIFESGVLRADGVVVPIEIHSSVAEIDGETLVVSSARDITDRKEAEQTIRKMAFYDQLTGLANRALFHDRLRIALAHSTRTNRLLAVMFLDIDHFKHVNDSLGHGVGDLLLQSIAARLSVNVREGDSLGRLGGDEFTFCFPDIESAEGAAVIARKILDSFNEPFAAGDRMLHMGASIGVALAEDRGVSPEELLARADAAMYRAKEDGRATVRFYEERQGSASASERFTLKNRIRAALECGEFELFYQPQVLARDGRIVGMEALIRWRHPERGLLAPSEFLALAEESGHIVSIGEWVLREACQQAVTWDRAGIADLRVAVNLSPRQFADDTVVALVADVLAETGLAPHCLELEITETMAMNDPARVRLPLEALRRMGVRVAIDDFGTGYSSLDHLRRIPVDALKIDRSFVADVETNPDAAAIANTVMVLAHNLGLTVVAEGVETEAQSLFLRERGCDLMQGFLYSPPLEADAFAALAASRPTYSS